ncbi:MAG: permease prefix domain 1-containing protein [Pyrinomonadaceae bacterium]
MTLRSVTSMLQSRAHEQQDVEDELQFHLAMLTQENLATGMSFTAAVEDAKRRFGDFERLRRHCLANKRQEKLVALIWLTRIAVAVGLMLWVMPINQVNVLGMLVTAIAILGFVFSWLRSQAIDHSPAGVEEIFERSNKPADFLKRQRLQGALMIALLLFSMLTAAFAVAGSAIRLQAFNFVRTQNSEPVK